MIILDAASYLAICDIEGRLQAYRFDKQLRSNMNSTRISGNRVTNGQACVGRPYFSRGWTGTLVVWVLRGGPEGVTYIAGAEATPPPGRAEDVIARLGPFAYEEGQGLEPFKADLERDAIAGRIQKEREWDQRQLEEAVRAEVDRRLPPVPGPVEPQTGEPG